MTTHDGAKEAWTTVCLNCYRIKRADGQWTDERAADVGGRNSGFCDHCAALERERQRAATGEIAVGTRSPQPLSD